MHDARHLKRRMRLDAPRIRSATVRLSDDELRRVDDFADAAELRRSEVLRLAIDAGWAKLTGSRLLTGSHLLDGE